MLVEIFSEIDDFCKEFLKQFDAKLLSNGNGKRKKTIRMTLSEIMTISIWYHYSGYKTFKDYYLKHVTFYLKKEFPDLVSYNRFIELRKKAIMPLAAYLQLSASKNNIGVAFIDSFSLLSCHIKRASSHKVLKNIATKGKTSVGWFFGLKLHLIINPFGEIIAFYITPGNVADNNMTILTKLTENLLGKIFGDRGYLLKQPNFEELYKKGIQLITKIKKNMKNKLLPLQDKLLLRKRGIIESIGNILKESLSLEHTRHRSSWSCFFHLFSTLIAYNLRPKKPNILSKSEYLSILPILA